VRTWIASASASVACGLTSDRKNQMTKMDHEKRAREDLVKPYALEDRRREAQKVSRTRQAAVDCRGKVLTLRRPDRCATCSGDIEAGTTALWRPNGRVEHLAIDCPARSQCGRSPKVVRLPTAGEREMWQSAS
jgi:hypothetical protein